MKVQLGRRKKKKKKKKKKREREWEEGREGEGERDKLESELAEGPCWIKPAGMQVHKKRIILKRSEDHDVYWFSDHHWHMFVSVCLALSTVGLVWQRQDPNYLLSCSKDNFLTMHYFDDAHRPSESAVSQIYEDVCTILWCGWQGTSRGHFVAQNQPFPQADKGLVEAVVGLAHNVLQPVSQPYAELPA